MSNAWFLGRFQPFHQGHYKVVEKHRDEFEQLNIVVGSAGKSRETDNPLSFEERKEIIRTCFPEITVEKLEDMESDEKWAEKLGGRCSGTLISGNELVQKLVGEFTDLNVVGPELHDPEIYSGSEIRRRMRSGEEWRYLVPKCAQECIEQKEEDIREAGINYNFEPGWKKKNAYHGTADQ